MDEKEIQSIVSQLKSKGAKDNEIKIVLQDYVDSKSQAAPTVSPRNTTGGDIPFFPDTLAKDIAKPFTKTAASLATTGAMGVAGLIGGKDAAQQVGQQAFEQGVPLPYFGDVKPIGADSVNQFTQGKRSAVGAGVGVLADLAGTAFEGASYAYAPLKLAAPAGGVSAVLKSIGPKQLLQAAKAVSPFAAPFAIGRGLQDYSQAEGGQGDKIEEGLKEAATAYGATALGFSVLNGGGAMLSHYGAKLLKNPVVKAFSEKLADELTLARDWVSTSSRQKLGEAFDYEAINFKNRFEDTVTGLSDAVMETFHTKVPNPQEILQGIRTKMVEYIGQNYRARNELFDKVLGDSDLTIKSAEPFKGVLSSVDSWVNDATMSAVKTGGLEDESINMVVKYLDRAKRENLTLRDAYRLYNEGSNYLTTNNEANQRIYEIQRGLMANMSENIKVSKPELMPQWDQARDFAMNVKQNVDTEFASKITSAPKINNLVDNMLTGGNPADNREAMAELQKAFPEAQDKEILSQMFFNSVIDKAKLFTTPSERAKVIDGAIQWANAAGKNSLLNEGHLNQLQQVSRLVNTNFSDAIVNAQNMGEAGGEAFIPQMKQAVEQLTKNNFISKMASKTENFRNYSRLGEEISGITSVEELNAILSLVEGDAELTSTIGKEIVRGIASRNNSMIVSGSGKVNEEAFKKQMTGILADLNKIGGSNKEEIFKKLFGNTKVNVKGLEDPITLDKFIIQMQESIDRLGSLENLSGENLLKAAHLITGLMYGFTSRPVPATYHLSQLAKINKNTSMPVEDLTTLINGLETEGYSLSGGYKGTIGSSLKKLGETIQDKSSKNVLPTLVGANVFEDVLKGAAKMMGIEVDQIPEDYKNSLQSEYDSYGY